MYLPRALIPFSTVTWPTTLPVPDNGQTAMAVQITSPTPTPVIETIEKRQPIYAPVEPYDPTLDVLARSATDALTERASDTDDRFDSILCATLKELKSENPSSFTSLLQSCTSLTDSTSDRRTRSIKERNVVANTKDFATNVEAIDHESGKAMLGRSNANLPETRDISAKIQWRSAKTKARTLCFKPL